MNKWVVVAVLALSVLAAAVELKAAVGGSLTNPGQGPMPRPKVVSDLAVVHQGPMPRPK